ncbi:MAG: rhodanese-like domain-containing protein [Solirubrobacteraceae bacterium]
MTAPMDATQTDIDPGQLAEWIEQDRDGVQLVDVREPYERDAGHIAGSRHIPMVALTDQASSLDRERPVVFYCRVGARSTMAAQAFRAAGFQALSMSGGLVRWAAESRPLAPKGGYVADH